MLYANHDEKGFRDESITLHVHRSPLQTFRVRGKVEPDAVQEKDQGYLQKLLMGGKRWNIDFSQS